jgi:HSP20 family protein
MSLTRWNPLQDLMSVRSTVDSLFTDPFFQPLSLNGGKAGLPALDIVEQEQELVIQAAVPGYKPEQIDVSVQGDVLTLSASMNDERERKEENFYLRERQTGSFRRSVRLPAPVNSDEATAEYDNGVLTLRLPKSSEATPKRIKVHNS